ncbi:DUF6923 family protein [Deinococcus hopiensis]|nr:PQQ-binding-like beta-propeller repeat protein [Deinococcus hopiensis]
MVALDATGPDLSLPLPPDGITVFADIARNPKNGAMYAITNSSLHVLNMQTGRDTLQGLLKVADMTALAFDLGGHLYAGSRSGRLYQVDQGTGKTTQIGTGQTTPAIAGDLAFSHDGTLYASVLAGTSDQLVTINVSTGEATPVGLIGFGQVYGLTFRGEMLYGMTEAGALIWIDRETGRGTLVRRTGLTATGME